MSFETALEINKPKKTPVSWEPLIDNILDEYYQNVDDLSHAVQKDAIQNSWDAKAGDSWKMSFTLMKDTAGREMLLMEDHGTVGLTGRMLPEETYDDDLPEEERWGRFQGLAFRRKKKEALGARGQGKFVFVGASRNRTIVYDTLRQDDIYRIGIRRLGNLWEFENAGAKDCLLRYSPSVSPLTEIGTRVIIDEPEDWLKDSLINGRFLRYIQTTWWPLLLDERVEISVNINGKKSVVTVPNDLQFPTIDSADFKVWITEWACVPGKSRKGLRIKRLHIVWSKEPLSDDIQGIAIIRGGMIVERMPISDLLIAPDPIISKHTYGYVEGDLGVQHKLKECEDPTHYRFTKKAGWGNKNIYQAIKDYVAAQMQHFSSAKLGSQLGKSSTGDYATLKEFNSLLKSIGIDIEVLSPPTPPRTQTQRTIQVSLNNDQPDCLHLSFPAPYFSSPIKRVEFDEEITNIRAKIINSTRSRARIHLSIYTEQDEIKRETLVDKEMTVFPNYPIHVNPMSLKIKKTEYAHGECHLKAKMVCLSHPDHKKGEELEIISVRFWIATDPPLGKGAFREVQYVPEVKEEIDGEIVRIDGKVTSHSSGDGNILLINTSHPLYKQRVPTKQNEQARKDYLIEMMAKKIPFVLISNNNGPYKDVEDPEEIFKRTAALYSKIMDKYFG